MAVETKGTTGTTGTAGTEGAQDIPVIVETGCVVTLKRAVEKFSGYNKPSEDGRLGG